MQHVAVLARAPSIVGKTRLTDRLDPRRATDLRRALLGDTLDSVRQAGLPVTLFFTPSDAEVEFAGLVGSGIALRPQGEGDLGARMHQAFSSLFGEGVRQAVLIGSDLPTLPPRIVRDAFSLLARGADAVVGPAADGGYYLLGLTRPEPQLFEAMTWGGPAVLAETEARARQLGLQLARVDEWYDVDVPDDLRRVAQSGEPAPRTRAWHAAFVKPGQGR